VGYCIYYNVFVEKFKPRVIEYVAEVMLLKLHILNQTYIKSAVELTAASLIELLPTIPGLEQPNATEMVIAAGRQAYAESYK
jgi:hypothetical protein